jgi:enoyl-CoA hydratase
MSETAENIVLVEMHGTIAQVTLNRPEKLNALNEMLRQRLMEILDSLALNDAVRVVVLCGAGPKAFVAGADISEFASRTPAEQRRVYGRRRVYDALAEFPKPILAAIHGHCLGGGSELALACDLRIADKTAHFAQAEIRLGLIPGAGGTQRMVHLVGPGQAMRLALTGDVIDASEAHRIGLVDFLVDEGKHVEKAMEVAERMARWSPVALTLAKRAVRHAMETPLSAGLQHEKELFLTAFASDDAREGVRAFMDRRDPDFRGT